MAAPSTPVRVAMERNLRVLAWWWVLRWAWLGEAIWVIYLIRERGLTIGEVLLFGAVFDTIAIAAEVPTGMLADRFGRRPSLLFSTALIAIGFAAFGLADTIPLLVGAYALLAVADAFMSGADNAILFDTLQTLGRGDQFARRLGRMNAVQTATMAVATVIGGAMVRWTPLSLPIVLSGVLTAPSVLLVLALREPPNESARLPFLRTGAAAGRRVLRARPLWTVILLYTFGGMPLWLMGVTLQPVVVGYGVPLWTLGIFAGAATALGAIGAWSSDGLGRRLGLRRTLLGMALLGPLALFGGASGLVWLFPLFIIPALSWNVMHPHVTDFLSRRAPQSERATVLSISEVSGRVAFVVITLLMAALVDRAGLHVALGAASAALLLLTFASGVAWGRSGDTEIAPPSPPGDSPPRDSSPGDG